MFGFRHRQADTFDAWLDATTRGLCDHARERIREELECHYLDAYDALIETGVPDAQAVAELGSPKKAQRRFKKIYLTRKEDTLLDGMLSVFLSRDIVGLPRQYGPSCRFMRRMSFAIGTLAPLALINFTRKSGGFLSVLVIAIPLFLGCYGLCRLAFKWLRRQNYEGALATSNNKNIILWLQNKIALIFLNIILAVTVTGPMILWKTPDYFDKYMFCTLLALGLVDIFIACRQYAVIAKLTRYLPHNMTPAVCGCMDFQPPDSDKPIGL